MGKSYKELKQILKDEDVALRSHLKTKQMMCDVLVTIGYFDKKKVRIESDSEVDELANVFSNTMKVSSKMQFNDIPNMIDVARQINNPRDLISFCSSNKVMSKLCSNDALWKDLFQRDFGYRKYVKESNMSWYQLYKDFVEYPFDITSIGIYDRGTLLEEKWIQYEEEKDITVTKAKLYGKPSKNQKYTTIVTWERVTIDEEGYEIVDEIAVDRVFTTHTNAKEYIKILKRMEPKNRIKNASYRFIDLIAT